jgi:hypothetical protein
LARKGFEAGGGALRVIGYKPARLFTLEEANAMLPEIRRALAELRMLEAEVSEADELLADAEAYFGLDGHTAANPEREGYLRLRQRRDEAHRQLGKAWRRFAGKGVEVKDLRRGLIDFPHWRGAELVYLCCEDGEDRIAFWHTLEAGYAGRNPLDPFPTAGL